MNDTWANIVKKNITYVGPPPGFTLVPYCLCKLCHRQNTTKQSFLFPIKDKPNIEQTLQSHNIHYKIHSLQKQFKIEFFACDTLLTKLGFHKQNKMTF